MRAQVRRTDGMRSPARSVPRGSVARLFRRLARRVPEKLLVAVMVGIIRNEDAKKHQRQIDKNVQQGAASRDNFPVTPGVRPVQGSGWMNTTRCSRTFSRIAGAASSSPERSRVCARCLVGPGGGTRGAHCGTLYPAHAAELVPPLFPQTRSASNSIGPWLHGAVFKVRQPKARPLRPIRLLPQSLAPIPHCAPFEREARLLARLNHAKTRSSVTTMGRQANSSTCLWSTWMEVNLRQAMRASGYLPPRRSASCRRSARHDNTRTKRACCHRDIQAREHASSMTKAPRVKARDSASRKLTAEADPAPALGTGDPSSPRPEPRSAPTQ